MRPREPGKIARAHICKCCGLFSCWWWWVFDKGRERSRCPTARLWTRCSFGSYWHPHDRIIVSFVTKINELPSSSIRSVFSILFFSISSFLLIAFQQLILPVAQHNNHLFLFLARAIRLLSYNFLHYKFKKKILLIATFQNWLIN